MAWMPVDERAADFRKFPDFPVQAVEVWRAAALPDGSTFEADRDLKRVFLEREDDSVTLVAVYSDSLGVDAGYRLARQRGARP